MKKNIKFSNILLSNITTTCTANMDPNAMCYSYDFYNESHWFGHDTCHYYIIAYQKLIDTITNENDPKIIDKTHAFYSANKLKIADIYSFPDSKHFKEHVSHISPLNEYTTGLLNVNLKKYKYVVGNTIDVSAVKLEHPVENIGIIYTNSFMSATEKYYQCYMRNTGYNNGNFYEIHKETGVMYVEQNFKNGKLNGHYIERDPLTGKLRIECDYDNGIVIQFGTSPSPN